MVVNSGVGGKYIMGAKHENKHIYITDANFHPDGQQVIWDVID